MIGIMLHINPSYVDDVDDDDPIRGCHWTPFNQARCICGLHIKSVKYSVCALIYI